jgi:transcription antitermination factor NusA-like protein
VNPINPKTQHNTDRRGANQVVNEVQVSDDLIGRLVGKKGAHIRHLEEVTRTKITISKRNEFYRGTTNRIITIYADSAEDNATVQRMIQEAISDPEISKRSANMANGGGPDNNGDGRSRNNGQQLSGDKLMERCMQVGPGATIPSMYVVPVPDTCIGSIMGIKGVNLQRMREETGTTIEISKRNHFFPNGLKDRILVIKGDPAQVSACQALIVGALDFPTQTTDKMKLKTFFERNPVSGGGVVPSYQQQQLHQHQHHHPQHHQLQQLQQLQQHQQPMPLQQHPMPLGMPMGVGSGYYPQGVQPPPLQYQQPQYQQPQPLMQQASYHPHQQELHTTNFPSSQQQHHSYQPAPQQEFREPSLQQQSSDFVASGGQGFAGTYGTGY